jgi:hypothetical protein
VEFVLPTKPTRWGVTWRYLVYGSLTAVVLGYDAEYSEPMPELPSPPYTTREGMEYLAGAMAMFDPQDESYLQGCARTYVPGQDFDHLVSYQAQRGRQGIVTFEQFETQPFSQYRVCVYEGNAFVMAYGFAGGEPDTMETFDLEHNGAEEIFFHVHDAGGSSGNYNEHLYVLRPSARWVVWINLIFGGPSYAAIPTPKYSDDFFSPENSAAAMFLESKKWRYGYIDQTYVETHADDPAFAAYFWMKDNDPVEDGLTLVREYQHPPDGYCSDIGEDEDFVQKVGGYTYVAVYKGPVVACANDRRTFFIAFHPHTSNNVSELKAMYPYLFIAMRSEGLAVLNLETHHLKRHLVNEPNLEQITVENGMVRLNDGEPVPMPIF